MFLLFTLVTTLLAITLFDNAPALYLGDYHTAHYLV